MWSGVSFFWEGCVFGDPAPDSPHTFVSRHFEVVDCGYYHEWRKQGWSDHSAMWTKLTLRDKIPELIEWEME